MPVVLLDMPRYLEANVLTPLDPLSYPSNIPVDLALFTSILAFQNLVVQPGDVVLVRLGFESAMKEDQARVAKGEQSKLPKRRAGIKAAWDMMESIWENGIVAIATDNGSFEDYYDSGGDLRLHPVLLSGRGVMIGELFSLNALAEECRQRDRWHFFFTSQPLMVDGGVGPPNAVAILQGC